MFLFNGVLMTLVQGGYVRRIAPGKELKTVVQVSDLHLPSWNLANRFLILGLTADNSVLFGNWTHY